MARQRHGEAAPGQRAALSIDRRLCSCALAGLESSSPSTGVHPPAASPTGGGADGSRQFSQPSYLACVPVPCATGALSSRLAGAIRSQCAHPASESGDDQTIRHPRSFCHLARFGDGLTLVRQPLGALFSDKLTSPSGPSWPLFSTVPQFFPSVALFALHPAVSAISHGQGVPFCTTFAYLIRISSSTTSLRNSWEL
jgi:hypothetical protein